MSTVTAYVATSGAGRGAFLRHHRRVGLIILEDNSTVARSMVTNFKGAGDAVMLAASMLLEEFPRRPLKILTTESSALGYFGERPFKKRPAAQKHVVKLQAAEDAGRFTMCRPEDGAQARKRMSLALKCAREAGTLETAKPGVWFQMQGSHERP